MTKLHIMIDKNKENTVDMNSGKLDFWRIDLQKELIWRIEHQILLNKNYRPYNNARRLWGEE